MTCIGGIISKSRDACCPTACGQCGGDGCAERPGGAPHCCGGSIHAWCRDAAGPPPCKYPKQVDLTPNVTVHKEAAGIERQAACTHFRNFVDMAKRYWHGEDVANRQLGLACRHLLTNYWERGCRLAKAAAHVLTAEFIVWASRPLAAEEPEGPLREEYNAEVHSYAMREARNAMQLMAESEEAAAELARYMARLLVLLSTSWDAEDQVGKCFATTAESIADSSSWAPGVALQYWRHQALTAAVEDHHWNEVWLPARPSNADRFWRVASLYSQTETEYLALDKPMAQWIPSFEDALKAGLYKALDLLQAVQLSGPVRAFWARSSTLIALLRWGRLFGHFHDGATDCVGDDVDLSVSISDAQGAWPAFVRQMAAAFGGSEGRCYVGGNPEVLGQPGGKYSQLLCLHAHDGFLIPVSFERATGDPPDLGACSAYDREVPCPSDSAAHLAKYGGCAAVPNITLASLQRENECVRWMEKGLSPAHVADLRSAAAALSASGHMSMAPILGQAGCSRIMNPDGPTLVGRSRA